MLVDANLLLYATDSTSPHHEQARGWLSGQLGGSRRVGLPWQSLGAFLRISTHARAYDRPLTPAEAWSQVERWLGCEVVWTPAPGTGYREILGALIAQHDIAANLVTDAQLAALALEHGLVLCSADSDFAIFSELTWVDPLAG